MSIREIDNKSSLKFSEESGESIDQIGTPIRMPVVPRGPAGSPIVFGTITQVGDREKVEIQAEYTPPSIDETTGETKGGAWFLGGNFAVSDSGDLNISPTASVKYTEDGDTKSIGLKDALEKIGQLEQAVSDLKSKPIKNALPVGSVLFSTLSESVFQGQYDGTWVRCMGQTVEGFGKVPDLQDRFPRVVSGEENIGNLQEQSTNKGDLGVNIDSLTGGRISINEVLEGTAKQSNANIKMFCDTRPPARGQGGDWHFYGGANSAIKTRIRRPNSNEYYEGEHNLIGADPNQGVPMGHGGQQIFKDVGHTHTVQVGLKKTFAVSGASAKASISGGTEETRPKACYLNAFIRVK